MRNLTIQRTKSFVACLVKMKVYIEDHLAFDTVINDVPCRKLGDLKNGEVKSFLVSNDAAKVFVIADKVSKSYCNEYYNLPEGQEDITLTGKNRFNLANGNAFRFDGVTDEGVLQNRKKGTQKGLIVLLIAFIVGLVIGIVANLDFNISTVKPKTFSEDGLSITLTNQFKTQDPGVFNAYYESTTMMVFTMKEEFTPGEEVSKLTLEEYGEILIKNNEQSARSQLMQDGELYYFVYDDIFDYRYYTWVTYIYKTDDAFWYVDFVTVKEDAEEHRAQISEWARTITFDGAAAQ